MVSEIVNKFGNEFGNNPTDRETKLREVISYIDYLDGYDVISQSVVAKPAGISDATIASIRDSRKFNGDISPYQFVGVVTSYSPRLAQAKEFLKFMYSKEGQEIMMETAWGLMSPIKVNINQFNYFKNDPTAMSRSKIELFNSSYAFGNTNSHPMQYLGGLHFGRYNGKLPSQFGAPGAAIRADEFNYWNGVWPALMQKAGVSN